MTTLPLSSLFFLSIGFTTANIFFGSDQVLGWHLPHFVRFDGFFGSAQIFAPLFPVYLGFSVCSGRIGSWSVSLTFSETRSGRVRVRVRVSVTFSKTRVGSGSSSDQFDFPYFLPWRDKWGWGEGQNCHF